MNLNISPVNFGKLHINRDEPTRNFIKTVGMVGNSEEYNNFRKALDAIDSVTGNTDVYMRFCDGNKLAFSLDKYNDGHGDIARINYDCTDVDKDPAKYYRGVVSDFKQKYSNVPECTKKMESTLNRFA